VSDFILSLPEADKVLNTRRTPSPGT
jgi:hypothetical protein